MEFADQLKDFTKRIDLLKDGIKTEEATKTSLVMPFFNLLGYDVFNPMEFCPEYTADVGIKKGEKVDYAILIDNIPQILIECKSCTESLSKYTSQLFRYFGTSKAKFGILTNGIVYKFYTDLEETNKMDLTPFLEVDLTQIRDVQINELKKFCKDNFDTDKIFSTASELKYSNLIKGYFAKELESPSEEFTKHILTYVYEGQRTQKVIEKYRPLVKKAFTSFVNDIVNQKIAAALTPDEEHADTVDDEKELVATKVSEVPIKVSKIVTTEEELQAFYIVRAIAAEITDIKNIAHRDTESYFGILFGDNNRKPICRVNLDARQRQLLLPDENKKFTRYYINNVDDIYKYKDNVDTDVIIPARYLNSFDAKELASHAMVDIDPTFASTVEKGDIIVAGQNFGCGSSREHAPLCLKTAGVKCVIAKSFARIFYRNSINIGFPIMECEEAADKIEKGDEVEVDFSTGVITNKTKNETYQSQPFPEFLQKMIDADGLVNYVNSKK